MAKTRVQKQEAVAELADKIRRMKAAAFASISGFTMKDADNLRIKGREAGVDILVTKKTLLKLAAKEAGLEAIDPSTFEGSLLSAFAYNDEVSAAKLLSGLAKEREFVKILGGVLEGNMVAADEVAKLAALPSKTQLLAQLVGSLNAPVSGFVNVLSGNLRGLVTVLKAVQEKKV
ncbi:MAG: 50S ribosomal protein L10 [Candidatus Uhrbacteria bacterium GW2011_GWE2_45_35]|uniref:Large ribosomal subunit protein uL10 n=2 Tax=Candidatus Uhriibacteriota TaxID=1752732 RepID=A0A0G1MF29_9BACT|nr:MAG: 50S ribosomal protein L10 [Candidatus Uhrbacteria bacterium GW2011_GWF2_44_350]KKU07420.1 MAG: 50S ribosomal protein L10 [Candidatus Uhrbacteria bacterium GW2011_GWE2_45_35]HBR80266.1 50S ribosomal protein L10 [Candidatus Uhrbacteria bacterium]HCU31746.1 50S ribosomal protein L10 [Candidatus Uhrbacteria bacterium]